MRNQLKVTLAIVVCALAVLALSSCVTIPEPQSHSDKTKEVTAESASACIYKVHNRGTIPLSLIKDVVSALRETPLSTFEINSAADVYSSVYSELGPYKSLTHRAAVMGNVMLVQAAFESSYKYGEGRDRSASNTSACTEEAGLYQTSGNMNTFSSESKAVLAPLQAKYCRSTDCDEFRRCTKEPVKSFVHGHFIRATRITTRHWGPMVRKEINPWLRRACVAQLQEILTSP